MASRALCRSWTSWTSLLMLLMSIFISKAGAESDTQAVNNTQNTPLLFPAALPIGINVPAGDPDFPDQAATTARIFRGMKDAIALARLACVFVNENLEEYQRYFEPGHALFIRSVFCNIAGAPMGLCNPAQFQQYNIDVNPLLAKLRITAGKDFDVTDAMRDEEEGAIYTGTLYQTLMTTYNIGKSDDNAIIELRKRAFDFPSIGEIHKIRGSKNLGSKVDGRATSLGALLLHELCHWRLLTRANGNEADFDKLMTETVTITNQDGSQQRETVDWIGDYKAEEHNDADIEPDDGYGPEHARLLEVNGHGDSFRNADNYRWCAVEIFWRWSYGKHFDEQDDNDQGDKLIPVGANGQIPYPGETLQSRDLSKDNLKRSWRTLISYLRKFDAILH